jgi:rhodanese-related sulfurtransferase
MFGIGGTRLKNLSAHEVKAQISDGKAMVVDVREADEFAGGHIAGAVNLPLSRFDPRMLPAASGKDIILSCAGGRRSAAAFSKCKGVRADVTSHLDGGLQAWIDAGLPVTR